MRLEKGTFLSTGDETEQLAMANVAGIDLVNLALAHKDDFEELFLTHLRMLGRRARSLLKNTNRGSILRHLAPTPVYGILFTHRIRDDAPLCELLGILSPCFTAEFIQCTGADPEMALELKIVSEHADLVGEDAVREFHEGGGTIGRSLQNDWILPDPDRFISGRHATIDYKGGIYYLCDISSNGVYVNGEVEPIGRGNPRRLFNGDKLRMGDFEFEVKVDAGESLVMPLDEKPSVAPDNIEQFVDEDAIRTGVQLLAEEITGDDVFKMAFSEAARRKSLRNRSSNTRSTSILTSRLAIR